MSKRSPAYSQWFWCSPGTERATTCMKLMLNLGEGRDSGSERKRVSQ